MKPHVLQMLKILQIPVFRRIAARQFPDFVSFPGNPGLLFSFRLCYDVKRNLAHFTVFATAGNYVTYGIMKICSMNSLDLL